MKYAVVDTETSGLFDFSKPADAEGQPRLAQFAAITLDDSLEQVDCREMLVKPDGWKMHPDAAAVNGLSDAQLAHDGVPVEQVLEYYTKLIDDGYVIVAFNAQFDTKMMRGELRRAEMDDRFEQTKNICTMRASTEVCKVPKKNGKGFKFPKLAEACAFFKIEQEAKHSALGDARACVQILRKLKELGVLPEPEVHYAKNQPEKAQ